MGGSTYNNIQVKIGSGMVNLQLYSGQDRQWAGQPTIIFKSSWTSGWSTYNIFQVKLGSRLAKIHKYSGRAGLRACQLILILGFNIHLIILLSQARRLVSLYNTYIYADLTDLVILLSQARQRAGHLQKFRLSRLPSILLHQAKRRAGQTKQVFRSNID